MAWHDFPCWFDFLQLKYRDGSKKKKNLALFCEEFMILGYIDM